MAGEERRTAASLLGVIAFLIVFGSLYPFSFAAIPGGAAALLQHYSLSGSTHSDVAANVLLYLPFGACLAWLAVERGGGVRAVALATFAGGLLSVAIEFAQLYETRRVTSLADVTSNTVGSFLGAWMAVALAESRARPGGRRFASLIRHPIAAALLFSWIGYRLAPFAPVLDADKWAAAVTALGERPGSAADVVLRHAVAWLVLAVACRHLAPARPATLLVGAMAAVLAGRVLFAGLALETGELAGMAVALALATPLTRLPKTGIAGSLAGLLLVLLAVEGLAPFDFQLPQDRFGFLPFSESLTQYRATNLSDVFLRCFTNGALVWLLVQAGLPVLLAAGFSASAVFTIELLQTWLPGERAEITDPLLAIAAGGLIALFEREPSR